MNASLLSKCLRALVLFFAAMGLLFCLLAGYACLTYPHDGPFGYVGEEACRSRSTAWHYLPLPPQEEKQLPMALDEFWGSDYAGLVIFRASAEWQELLCRFFPREEWVDTFGGIVPDADKAGEPRMGEFIRSHEWTEFHQARVGRSGTYFRALRDASGEYVMVEFFHP